MKRHAPATQRNREPILDVLRPLLPGGARVLEIASGTGEHAAFFTARMPDVTWQPSDADPDNLASIEAHRAEAALPNLRAPVVIDAARGDLGGEAASAVVCINMIHIAPWEACEGLVRGAAGALDEGGVLFLYGPYRITGAPFAPSNEAFDASLRARDPRWGVRSLDEVTALAARAGLGREAVVAMPANNCSVVFRKRPVAP
jgi:SAM-dependent methyltransferase